MKNQFLNKLLYLKMKWTSLKKQRIKKTESLKSSIFDWLINYLPKPVKKLKMKMKLL